MNASIGTSRHTTVAAFAAASRIIEGPYDDVPANDLQAAWLDRVYVPCRADLPRLPEVVANATRDPQNHVDFLAAHGWQAPLVACPRGGFLTAAVLDVLVRWLECGQRTELVIDGVGTFPAAHLDVGVSFERDVHTGNVIVTLTTKTDDQVLLTMAPHAPTDARELIRLTDEAFGGKRVRFYDHDGLTFPMVDLASRQELGWMVGLQARPRVGDPFSVAKAVQQTTLKMNHEGARARAADEVGFTSESVPQPPFRIDRPFLAAFRRPGLNHFLYEAYVAHDAWRDPGGLGT